MSRISLILFWLTICKASFFICNCTFTGGGIHITGRLEPGGVDAYDGLCSLVIFIYLFIYILCFVFSCFGYFIFYVYMKCTLYRIYNIGITNNKQHTLLYYCIFYVYMECIVYKKYKIGITNNTNTYIHVQTRNKKQ